MNDIQERSDIDLLVRRFYDKLLSDDLMKPIFLDVIKIDFEAHFDILVDFWDNILFFTGTYQRNAMLPHLHLQKLYPLKKEHFITWLKLWDDSLNELFVGEKASLASERAHSIGTIMETKINQMNTNGQ